MKKNTLVIVLVLVGLLICVNLVIWGSVFYFAGRGSTRASGPTSNSSANVTATNISPLVGKWLCNNCAGRAGVSILREYLADGTWTGHVTDARGNTYDYHGTYKIVNSNQYDEVDLTNGPNPTSPPGKYRFSINGNTLILELVEGDSLTAEFQRVK